MGIPTKIPEVYHNCSPISLCAQLQDADACWYKASWIGAALPNKSEQFYTVLKANGCIVEMLRQPGGSAMARRSSGAINLRRAHNDAMLDWFARYVLAQAR